MGDLELYPKTNWRRALAYGVALTLLAGAGTYRWVTTSTPVDQARALEIFRSESGAVAAGTEPDRAGQKKVGKGTRGDREPRREQRSRRKQTQQTRGPVAAPASAQSRDTGTAPRRRGSSRDPEPSLPREGVYSWDTDGYEQVGGARRQFPERTQRIITHDGSDSWTTHHYFSEEREFWTMFHVGDRGAEITRQRNKVTFGPVTNDSTIDFSPPMLVGPWQLQVGMTWKGTWTGDTYGNYSSRIFEHRKMRIGNATVEVWGISYDIRLRGEQRGRVQAKVWLAPSHSMTVQEHYIQDVEVTGGSYHAEWEMTMRSMRPQR